VKLRNQTRWASSDEEADIVGLPSSGPKQSMPYGGGSAGVGMNDTLRSDPVALSKIKNPHVNSGNATAPAGEAQFLTSSATIAPVLVSCTPARSMRRQDISSAIWFVEPQASQATLTL